MSFDITSPRSIAPYEGRHRDCEAALEPSLFKLLRQARTAGWIEGEVIVALQALTRSHLQWILSTGETEVAASARGSIRERRRVAEHGDAPGLVKR